jgi:hypothetical protein
MKASLLCSCVGIINGVVLVVGRTRRHKSIERVVSSIPAVPSFVSHGMEVDRGWKEKGERRKQIPIQMRGSRISKLLIYSLAQSMVGTS